MHLLWEQQSFDELQLLTMADPPSAHQRAAQFVASILVRLMCMGFMITEILRF
jgi:hypothetical protein